MERKYFSINGYWKDNNEEFEGYIVEEGAEVGVSQRGFTRVNNILA
jgi:hypothetical protein